MPSAGLECNSARYRSSSTRANKGKSLTEDTRGANVHVRARRTRLGLGALGQMSAMSSTGGLIQFVITVQPVVSAGNSEASHSFGSRSTARDTIFRLLT